MHLWVGLELADFYEGQITGTDDLAEFFPVNHMDQGVRYFRNPCDRDPPTENFKNFKFLENSLKILNVYFWGKNVYFWVRNVYFWGNNVYFWGLSGFSGFF